MHVMLRSFQRLLFAAVYLLVALAGNAAELFDFGASFDPAHVITRGTAVARMGDAVQVTNTLRISDCSVVFPLP